MFIQDFVGSAAFVSEKEYLWSQVWKRESCDSVELQRLVTSGRKIAPNTGANAPKFFTLATKS